MVLRGLVTALLTMALVLSPALAHAFPHTAFYDADQWAAPTPMQGNRILGPWGGSPAGPFAWAYEYMRDGAAWELILGYPRGDAPYCVRPGTVCPRLPEFRPAGTITRAEFAAVLARVTGFEEEYRPGEALDFADTDNAAWYARYLAPLVRRDVVRPADYGGRLQPDQPITRGEMAVWLARAVASYGMPVKEAALNFSDVADFPYRQELAQALALGIIRGYPDGTFRPGATANRAEALTMLVRLVPLLRRNPPSESEVWEALQRAVEVMVTFMMEVQQRPGRLDPNVAKGWIPGFTKFTDDEMRSRLGPFFTDVSLQPMTEERRGVYGPADTWFEWDSLATAVHAMAGDPLPWPGRRLAGPTTFRVLSDRYALVETHWYYATTPEKRQPVWWYLVRQGGQWKVSQMAPRYWPASR